MTRDISKDKKNILKYLSQVPIIEAACQRAGVPRSTYYRWLDEDPDFAFATRQALQLGYMLVSDIAESRVISKIKEGAWPALIYWLGHHKEPYNGKFLASRSRSAASQDIDLDELFGLTEAEEEPLHTEDGRLISPQEEKRMMEEASRIVSAAKEAKKDAMSAGLTQKNDKLGLEITEEMMAKILQDSLAD